MAIPKPGNAAVANLPKKAETPAVSQETKDKMQAVLDNMAAKTADTLEQKGVITTAEKEKIVPTKTAPVKTGILSRVRPVSDTSMDNLCIMLNGRAGSGKTTIAATAPKPLLLVDIREQGTKSISDVEGVFVFNVESWDDVSPDNPTSIFYDLKANPTAYKTIVFDTLTQLQDVAMDKVLRDAGRSGEKPYLADYGTVNTMIKNLVRAYKELPMVKIFICQEKVNNTEGKAAEQLNPEYGPAVSPGIALAVCAAMDVIGHAYIDESPVKVGNQVRSVIQHKLRIAPHRNYLAKVRKPLNVTVPDFIVNPTYDDIASIVQGKYKPKER